MGFLNVADMPGICKKCYRSGNTYEGCKYKEDNIYTRMPNEYTTVQGCRYFEIECKIDPNENNGTE